MSSAAATVGLITPQQSTALKADLVLSGGGVKGIGLAGAVVALMEAGYGFEGVSGTSAARLSGPSWRPAPTN